ncbi:MAG: S8 family serine peptidase, partial [Xanthomonadales bacterium]|nr:S8 family serine peptidase [Xanthomonadales bacterium]
WPNGDGTGRARCNSFTLAQALAAAIRSPARVINLSLGGPHDALLGELLEHAVARGTIVVGAVAPDAGIPGFPVSTKGVIAVDSSGAPGSSVVTALHAPGEEILTLEPGGHYDYASGSSLAAAHVTGAIALLLQVSPRLDASRIVSLLRNSARHEDGAIDACIAVSAASGHQGTCSPD